MTTMRHRILRRWPWCSPGKPTDLALVRMQTDGLLPAAKRSNYRSVIDALVSITKAEGGRALWAGAIPTIARAMSLNLGPNKLFTMKDVKNPC
ncbi:hypothetical protein FOXG_12968 [Fusarium oxysporum f. sp. lycopersici 4287]|uniref:Uncharacterized protein n=2 Tax=Fusarium oxysporum TaxID=5507 RepID=A0A0J9VS34_FUSO4|nr:hypothetical protein FOXG_12968 [Fusarium oxysporum f. sp. lycopersici 4287]KNB13475.1 hypothetical protein FOXG_12968 [Fusarium oxysporum f. sp. lycopersici 4287]